MPTTLLQLITKVAFLCGDTAPFSDNTTERYRLAVVTAMHQVQAAARWSILFRAEIVPDEYWEQFATGFLKPPSFGQVLSVDYLGRKLARVTPKDYINSYLHRAATFTGTPRVWCPYTENSVALFPMPSAADRENILVYTQVGLSVSDTQPEDELDFPEWFLELVLLKSAEVYSSRYVAAAVSESFRREYEELLSRYSITHSRNHPSQGRMYGSTI